MLRILVVDDDEACRRLVVRLLEAWGYEVSEAENGLDGLAVATTHKPNVVVTDVNMPYLNGWDARRELARNTSTSTILVIVLTI